MPTSIEKLQQLEHDFTRTPPAADAEPGELALRTGLQMFGPAIRAQLPELPADLDELLERGAQFLLSMRSDDAEPATIAFTENPPVLGQPELDAAAAGFGLTGPEPDAD